MLTPSPLMLSSSKWPFASDFHTKS